LLCAVKLLVMLLVPQEVVTPRMCMHAKLQLGSRQLWPEGSFPLDYCYWRLFM